MLYGGHSGRGWWWHARASSKGWCVPDLKEVCTVEFTNPDTSEVAEMVLILISQRSTEIRSIEDALRLVPGAPGLQEAINEKKKKYLEDLKQQLDRVRKGVVTSNRQERDKVHGKRFAYQKERGRKRAARHRLAEARQGHDGGLSAIQQIFVDQRLREP